MTSQLSINLSNTIESLTILDTCPAPIESDYQLDGRGNDFSDQNRNNCGLSEAQETAMLHACQALSSAAGKVQKFYEKVVAQQREEIAKLSVEIARMILKHKVETKDYEIESIVKEVLKNSPLHQDVVVHLNPEDLEQCRKIQKEQTDEIFADVKLVADPNIGRAECILKSPKGNICSLINEHLEQISEALGKVK